MSEMVDRLAKALLLFNTSGDYAEKFPDGGWSVLLSDKGRDYWRSQARGAINALREPTEEMKFVGSNNDMGISSEDIKISWQLMIDEALR